VPGAVNSRMPLMPLPHRSAAHPADRSSPFDDADRSGRLRSLLDRQAGVVSRAQALAAGLAPRDIDRLLARRRWRPVHPRVYLAAGHPLSDDARIRAAALWAGDGAVVVGAAALWWHGLGRVPATVGLAVPRRCPAPRPGVLPRRRALPAADVVLVRGLLVPVRPLALLDAAVEAGGSGIGLLRDALRGQVAGGVDLAELRAVAGRSAGPTTARRLLVDVMSAPPRTSRNVAGLGIATVNCEHCTHPRGRRGRSVPSAGAR
jgi:hypothetical protein